MKNGKHKTQADPLDDEVRIDTLRFVDTGKYFKQKAAEHRYVQLDADVFARFPTARDVNGALRELLRVRETLIQIAPERVAKRKSA